MKKCTIGSHKGCVVLSTGDMKLAITTQCGPRIIGCFIGKDSKFNQFAQIPDSANDYDNGYKLYGGHRLWHSPEDYPLSYEPDNAPVKITEYDSGVEFATAPGASTGVSKKILVEPLQNGLFCITHTIENCGVWPIELAPWALTMMAPGGMAIIPQNRDPEDNPFAPDRALMLWPYSDLKDPRLTLGHDFIMLKQDPKAKDAIKIGFNNRAGWAAYVNGNSAFVKYFDYEEEGDYPDGGCTVESYSCNLHLELETLAPLETLEPGECAQHVEYWQGITGLHAIKTEADIVKYLQPQLLASEDPCGCGCEDDDCECGCGCGEDDCDCGCGDDACECGCHDEAPAAKKSRCKK